MNREKSIELLNKAVAEELLSTEQYLYFHFHCADKGFMPLADIFMRISIVEMKHIDALAERILFLKGDVDLAPSGTVKKIRDVSEMLKFSCKLEEGSIADYKPARRQRDENAFRKAHFRRGGTPRHFRHRAWQPRNFRRRIPFLAGNQPLERGGKGQCKQIARRTHGGATRGFPAQKSSERKKIGL